MRLIIRFMGIVGILYVVRHWAHIYHKNNGSIHFKRNEWGQLAAEICLIIIGLYMVRGAPLLVRLITGIDSQKEDSDKSPKP
jgi:hypothetical protein